MKHSIHLRFALIMTLIISILAPISATEDVSFSLNCPPDVVVACDAELWDLSIYGTATYTSNYATYSAGSPVVEYFLNSCDIGVIKRTWTVEDPYWNPVSCTQIITVEGSTAPFDIEWPEEEVTVEGCNPDTSPAVTGSPWWVDGSPCSLIGVNHSDIIFTFGPQCKKIRRTWKIIDWCVYNPDLGQYNGYYEYVQTIKVSENTPPQYTSLDTIVVPAYNCKDKYVTIPTPTIDASACGGAYQITHSSTYADTTGVDASGTYPIGTYAFTYQVKYGCSGKTYIKQVVVVENAAKPTPYCLASITTALMGVDTDNNGLVDDGMVEIWAKDFNLGSYYTCNNSPLTFSFSPDVSHMSQVFTCADVGVNELKIYVTDHYGNQSYCIVKLIVQNNAANIPDCEPAEETELNPYVLSGRVASVSGQILQQAEIIVKKEDYDTLHILTPIMTFVQTAIDSTLEANGTYTYIYQTDTLTENVLETVLEQMEKTVAADESGNYTITNLPTNTNYILQSKIDTVNINTITAQDAMILSAHLQGTKLLDNTFALKAADIDGDGEVDYDDFYALMKVVRDRIFPSSITEYWYTYDESSFAELGDLYPQIQIENFITSSEGKNFIAIQKGDLSALADLEDQMESNDGVDTNRNSEIGFRDWQETGVLGSRIAAFPNPFKDAVYLNYFAEANEVLNIAVFNSLGQQSTTLQYSANQGDNIIEIEGSNFLNSGIYKIQILTNNRLKQVRSLTVVKE